MDEYVLDASALLALIKREAGWERVAEVTLRQVSTVNLAEAGSFLTKLGYTMDAVAATFAALRLRVVSFDEEQAMEAARSRPLTLAFGLSLGDRACLALATLRRLPVLTAERSWEAAAPHVAVVRIR